MARSERKAPPLPDPENGLWQGRFVARRFVSPDGLTVLVGRTAEDNDVLTFKLGSPRDFWFHLAGDSGSHVVVRNPQGARPPAKGNRAVRGSLAAGYSKGKKGGRVSVHICRCEDVSKPRRFPPGKVLLDRYKSVQVAP